MSARQRFIDAIEKACERNFDIFRDYRFGGVSFPLYAEYHCCEGPYVLSKKAKLWEVGINEYLFAVSADHLDLNNLRQWKSFMTSEALKKANPTPNHMTSYLTLIIVAESMDESVRAKTRFMGFRKNHWWGFRGWTDFRLVVVSLQDNTICCNGQGKALKPLIKGIVDKSKGKVILTNEVSEGAVS